MSDIGMGMPMQATPEFPLAESISLVQDDQSTPPAPPPTHREPRSSRALQEELALNADPQDPELVRTIRRQRPGVPARMQQLLQKSDAVQAASWLERDPAKAARVQVALEQLSARHPKGWVGVQSDVARLDHAATTGRLSGGAAAAWSKLMSGSADEDVMQSIVATGDALDLDVDDDLGVGPFGKVARVDVVAGNPAVVVEYPVAPSMELINFGLLAEQSDARVGKLIALAGDEIVEDPDEVEVAQAVFGTSKITEVPKAARFAINDLLDRWGEPGEVAKTLVAGWRRTRRIGDIDIPDDDGPNPLGSALSGLVHPAAMVKPSGLTEMMLSIDGPALGEIRSASGTTVVADVTPESSRLLNHLYPAIQGRDGKARWLPVNPMPVKDPRRVTARLTAPDATVDEWMNSELVDGHPLTHPGDRIVFETDKTVPDWYGSARRIGKALSESPELRIEPVNLSEWSEDRLLHDKASPLRTHLFGMFVQPDGSADIQFGKTAEALAEIADASGLPFVSNTGVYPEDAEIPDTLMVNGIAVPWRDYSDELGDPTITYRAGRISDRFMLEPRPDQLATAAKSLMELGATAVSVYTAQENVDGFERVSEHLVSDGVSTRAYRTRHHDPADPSAGFVWVPAGSRGITPPDVTPPPPSYEMAARVQSPLVVTVGNETVRTFTVGEYGFIPTSDDSLDNSQVVVRNTGQRAVISVPDGQLEAAIAAAQMVRRAGYTKRIVLQGEQDWVFSDGA